MIRLCPRLTITKLKNVEMGDEKLQKELKLPTLRDSLSCPAIFSLPFCHLICCRIQPYVSYLRSNSLKLDYLLPCFCFIFAVTVKISRTESFDLARTVLVARNMSAETRLPDMTFVALSALSCINLFLPKTQCVLCDSSCVRF